MRFFCLKLFLLLKQKKGLSTKKGSGPGPDVHVRVGLAGLAASSSLQNRHRPSLRLGSFLIRNHPKRNGFKGFFGAISMISSVPPARPAGRPRLGRQGRQFSFFRRGNCYFRLGHFPDSRRQTGQFLSFRQMASFLFRLLTVTLDSLWKG